MPETRDDLVRRLQERETEQIRQAGNQGKWVLIQGERIVGIWDARNPALPWFSHPTLVVMDLPSWYRTRYSSVWTSS